MSNLQMNIQSIASIMYMVEMPILMINYKPIKSNST